MIHLHLPIHIGADETLDPDTVAFALNLQNVNANGVGVLRG